MKEMCDALLLYLTRTLVVLLLISPIFLPKDEVRRTYATSPIIMVSDVMKKSGTHLEESPAML
jgi:hypothetical protein